MDYVLSLKGSVGVLVSPETLLYGFVGVSYGSFEYSVTGNGRIAGVYIEDNASGSGYVAGFGLERALTDRWSLRSEYQYCNIGKSKLSDVAGNTTKATPDSHSFRLGLNLSF